MRKTPFKGETTSIKDYVFVHSQLHTKKWITSRQKFIDYAAKTYGGNEATSLEKRDITIITMDEPIEPVESDLIGLTDLKRELKMNHYIHDYKVYMDMYLKTTNNLTKLYEVLWGQCDPIMKNKIKADRRYTLADAKKSSIELLSIIETICEQGDITKNKRVQRLAAMKKVLTFRQHDEMDLGEYLEKFEILVSVAEKTGVKFYADDDIKDVIEELGLVKGIGTDSFDEEEKVKRLARERALAILFFDNSNDNKYAIYKQECRNAMAKGRDEYPTTVIEAHTALEDFRFNPKHYQMRGSSNKGRNTKFSGHSFLLEAEECSPAEKEAKYKRKGWRPQGDYICYNCDRKNECMADDCPHKTKGNGDPTRDERRRMWRERKQHEGTEEQQEEQALFITDEDDNQYDIEVTDEDDWALELTRDDYGMAFHMVSEVVVEDLRDESKGGSVYNRCKQRLNPNWILLDNCSSINVFFNGRYLKNIRVAEKSLHLYTNAGKAVITMVGDLPGFGEVYYYPEGIANILSFHNVVKKDGYSVQYDNGVEDAFTVTNPRGMTRRFTPSKKGLYYWNSTKAIQATGATTKKDAMVLVGTDRTRLEEIAVETIKGNTAKFSTRDNSTARKARELQNITNWSNKDMMRVAKYGPLINNPFSPRDITVMKKILGPSIPGLQGKNVRARRVTVPTELTGIPQQIMDNYGEVTVSIDIMKVNKIPFLVSISDHIHYGTSTAMPDMTEETMFSVLKELDQFYMRRGFKINVVLADKQFQCLDNSLAERQMMLNIAAQDEHVPQVERYIRVLKERMRCAIHNTPFTKIPPRMVIGLMAYVLFYINGLPWERGVSMILSPMTIVTGRKLDYKLHCKVPFGAYAHVRRGTDNTMKHRTFGAIAMGPMSNMQGGMTFMSLLTGRKIERDKPDYTILPMPDEVVDQVNRMGHGNPDGLLFTDAEDNDLDIEEEMEETMPDNEEEEQSRSDEESMNEQDNNNDVVNDEVPEDNNSDMDDGIENTGVDTDESVENTGVDRTDEDVPSTDDNSVHTEEEENEETIEFEYQKKEVDQTEGDSNNENDEEDELGVRPVRRTIQPYVWPGFEEAFTNLVTDGNLKYGHQRGPTSGSKSNEQITALQDGDGQHQCDKAHSFLTTTDQRCDDVVEHYVMIQHGLKAGLRIFGERGKAAMMKEMTQMLTREVFEEIAYESLSREDKRLALPILLFLTEKRNGDIKGRLCADGRKQRVWMVKTDTKSPTVATEALFYLFMIDAYEDRTVATVDLPGHFLQTPMEGRLILRIDSDLALILVEINPAKWKKHLKRVHGKWVIFVRCNKAIYGTLNAALLSYKKLVGHLSEWGFTMNPYDPCVWNKIINEKQMTVAFHVDDMKISHPNEKEVIKVINQLRDIYGKTDPMTENIGKIHEYLGMTVDYSNKGEVKITMYDYVQKMINDLNEDMIGVKKTAAPDHLFRTDDSAEKLDNKMKEYFHTMTARALYLSKRARPDLQTAVAFLCTRVQEPDIHDYNKLCHLMKYLQATKQLPLIIRYDGKEISLYIDGAHAVHADMKGHVGVHVTGGGGTIYGSSSKAKLNTTSSTETEVISVGERLPKHIWFRYFRLAQGGDSGEDVLYQDNEAAMLLQKNGRMSCGKGSKHIHIRYFFITDKIKQKELKVLHCPTEEMIADYYTKPLQGGQFYKFRDLILGINVKNMDKYKEEYREAITSYGLTPTAAAVA